MDTIEDAWHVIEGWLRDTHGDPESVLAPPATDGAIGAVEDAVGTDLPPAFVSFLRVHGGQTPDSRPLLRRFGLLTPEGIVREYRRMSELLADGTFDGRIDDFADRHGSPEEGVRDRWWHDRWVPFATDAGGNYRCVDLDPTPRGTYGQVITVWHDAPTRPVVSRQFESWFAGVADALEDGRYVYSAETHSMMARPEEL